jgi:hypothetical protein
MKYFAVIVLALAQVMFAHSALAGATPNNAADTQATVIPIVETEFVNAINGFDKAQIIAQFGEPAKADDVKIKGSGKIVASIWQYHFINTSANGTYYETTELDFIDDKVVSVVFLNNDGAEGNANSNVYEVPASPPAL